MIENSQNGVVDTAGLAEQHFSHILCNIETEESNSGLHEKVQGDRYRLLYLEYKNVVIDSLLKKGWSTQDAEDITQEAFVRLIRLKKSQAPRHPKSYVYRIAHNLAIDKIRRSKCVRFMELDHFSEANLDAEFPMRLESTAEAPLEMRDSFRIIIRALNELPKKCQTAFYLYKIQGQGYDQISMSMSISQSMVRKYVLRAIRHCLEQVSNQRLSGSMMTCLPREC